MKINPFVLSQVREKQNELIMTLEPIDKIEVSNIIYSFYDAMKEKESFFRCVKTHKYTVAAFYWKTNMAEVSSGRTGLYIVIGFLLTDYDGNYDAFWSCSTSFFKILEQHLRISLQSKDADELFTIIQQEPEAAMQKLEAECKKLQHSFGKVSDKRFFWRDIIKRRRNFGKINYVYMLNDNPDFYGDWSAFMREALAILDMWGCGDVSSLEDYTKYSIHILQNGCKIPVYDIKGAWLVKYRDYRYLIMS